ncbi:transcriptional regulator [Paraflavitalea soli]|uniref:Transcriptional regulator n=1 Tax=Paraflavitalea soli TaxID=2315862 RepID=A0A3B7MDY9_9BACT|nr:helix-turn-helix transcriptional regulator [Paraflavitalea soli]AXY72492.1 transcriptional regulator [Paraflavitalea soli]
MEFDQQFSAIASLIGEPARAAMLWSMLDGRAYTAGELALMAGISPQSASNHLNKLIEADLLKMEKQGKHRYYRFAKPEVATAMEAISRLIPHQEKLHRDRSFKNGDIQYARTCYDHLAGRIAVNLTQGLVKQKIIQLKEDEFDVTNKGMSWFDSIGVDIAAVRQQKRFFARPCLDWTEKKHHLAGALGAALLDQMLALNWIRRKANERTVILTGKGEKALAQLGVPVSTAGSQ